MSTFGRAPLLALILIPMLHPVRADAVGRSRADAVPVSAGSVRLDGALDEPVWREARFVSGFTQKYPDEGEPSTRSELSRPTTWTSVPFLRKIINSVSLGLRA